VEEGDENEEGEPISDGTRKSGRVKVPNRRYEDYELYVTVAEEEAFLLVTNEEEFDDRGCTGEFSRPKVKKGLVPCMLKKLKRKKHHEATPKIGNFHIRQWWPIFA
jgi:hypothetical protein